MILVVEYLNSAQIHFAKILVRVIERTIFALIMNKTFAISLLAIVTFACNTTPETPTSSPYKFDKAALQKQVKQGKMMLDSSMVDSQFVETYYYLPDTGKFRLFYDKQRNLKVVEKFNEHGIAVWQEYYHNNGQRAAHYPFQQFQEFGPQSVRHGLAEMWDENGMNKSHQLYQKGMLMWQVEFDKEGNSGDTLEYDYSDKSNKGADADTEGEKKDKPKVEKIETATTPN